jgi:hypothetical protein
MRRQWKTASVRGLISLKQGRMAKTVEKKWKKFGAVNPSFTGAWQISVS